MSDPTLPERLWTAADLAAFLGYSETTVARLASTRPTQLPPRVAGFGKLRWVPQVCQDWVKARSTVAAPAAPRPRGRPRRSVA